MEGRPLSLLCKQGSRFPVIPDIRYRESILLFSDGSPLPTGGDDKPTKRVPAAGNFCRGKLYTCGFAG